MESKPNTDPTNTDPMERAAAALERLCRIQAKATEEIIEIRREIRAINCTIAEAHNLV